MINVVEENKVVTSTPVLKRDLMPYLEGLEDDAPLYIYLTADLIRECYATSKGRACEMPIRKVLVPESSHEDGTLKRLLYLFPFDECVSWLPQPGQVLKGKDGFDFLTLWPHLDAYAALDGTEQAREGSLGVVTSNRALNRAEALAEIWGWYKKGAILELSAAEHDDYGIWETGAEKEAREEFAETAPVCPSRLHVRSMIDQIKGELVFLTHPETENKEIETQ